MHGGKQHLATVPPRKYEGTLEKYGMALSNEKKLLLVPDSSHTKKTIHNSKKACI